MLKRRKKVTILIPARLNSKRLPGKLLIEIQGLPIIEHVRRRAELNKHKAEVYVVSNDEKILKTVIENGGKTIRTYKKHLNGTSRCSEAAKLIKSDFFLILQGDEILALPRHIDELISEALIKPDIKIINLISKLKNLSDLKNKNVVKCFLGKERQVIALFRKSPSTADPKLQMNLVFKVLGIFIFEASTLRNLSETKIQPLEKLELIEQLRIQEIGITLNTLQVDRSLESVNTESDLIKIKKDLIANREQRLILNEIIEIGMNSN